MFYLSNIILISASLYILDVVLRVKTLFIFDFNNAFSALYAKKPTPQLRASVKLNDPCVT